MPAVPIPFTVCAVPTPTSARQLRPFLQDEEWSKWSDSEIAGICGVGHSFVSELRKELTVRGRQKNQPVRLVVKGNTTYEMDTRDAMPEGIYQAVVMRMR